jgi:hypothetical protein
VPVAPGRWLVEATLPSGEIVAEEVMVPNNKSVPVTLCSYERSPNPWLSWQHLLGNVEGVGSLKGIVEHDHVDDINITQGGHPWLARGEEPVVRQTLDVPSGYGSAWTRMLKSEQSTGPTCLPVMTLDESATWLYRFENINEGTLGFASGRRRFADVVWGTHRYLVSLPLPWPGRGPNGPVSVELMLRIRPSEGTAQIGLAVLDEEFGSLSGLMTTSTLPQAAVAVKQAQNMLFAKMQNPLAAVAGGYILLSTADSNEHDWHRWIENLERRFPGIPDGAILKGSLRLRCPHGNKSAPMEARASFLEAYSRGIPYFSAGVSWLLDGLTLFADDRGIAAKTKRVQRVAQRMDVSQAFTVIKLDSERRQ